MKRRFLAALSLMLVGMTAIACSGGDSDSGTDTAGSAPKRVSAQDDAGSAYTAEEEGELVDSAGSVTGTSASSGGSSDGGGGGTGGDVYQPAPALRGAELPDLGLSVIKTATVTLEVGDDELQDTLQNATTTAEKYGGFVISSAVSKDREHPTGSIVVRIPATRFGDALADLESLGRVDSESVSGQDVTQEFIDLQARLRNYVAQETVLLRLMDRAQSVTDTIRVQNELQRVQLEIERLRRRITYLEDQTSMSTIELRVAEEGAIADAPGEFEKAWERAKDGLVAVVAGLITSLGVVVPLAVLVILAILVFTWLKPRFTSS